jgi:hypothetical protein
MHAKSSNDFPISFSFFIGGRQRFFYARTDVYRR